MDGFDAVAMHLWAAISLQNLVLRLQGLLLLYGGLGLVDLLEPRKVAIHQALGHRSIILHLLRLHHVVAVRLSPSVEVVLGLLFATFLKVLLEEHEVLLGNELLLILVFQPVKVLLELVLRGLLRRLAVELQAVALFDRSLHQHLVTGSFPIREVLKIDRVLPMRVRHLAKLGVEKDFHILSFVSLDIRQVLVINVHVRLSLLKAVISVFLHQFDLLVYQVEGGSCGGHRLAHEVVLLSDFREDLIRFNLDV